jgi:hypothetical protein
LRYLKGIFMLLALVLATAGCATKKFKAPRCEGTFERVNTPEHYLQEAGK